jgi:hypothetical protein
MVVFITACLAVFVLAFFTMIAVMAIRVEKRILELVDVVESKVTRLYGQNE